MAKDEDMFDFGFTLVGEEDVAVEDEDRIKRLYDAFQPLLKNLKKDPEKEYIKWPDRIAKVEEFEERIRLIYEGGPE